MAEIYCDFDGEARLRQAILEIGKHPDESTKIVSGRLVVEGKHCDKCSLPLFKGDIAYYVAVLHKKLPDSQGELKLFGDNTGNGIKRTLRQIDNR